MKELFNNVIFSVIAALLPLWQLSAQEAGVYRPLDTSDPVYFFGDHIIYKGEKIILGPKAFFIDGQLSDAEVSKHPYVFNSINKAAVCLTNGTEGSPMVLYIAPWVYWIDDPDDPAVRVGKGGQSPFGLIINCEWLRFHGLSDNPVNVVLACNRGQTIGSQGNFTMFRISGDGTSSENITFGNYCNVDLEYPLKPELSRKKRASAIVQAQLISCNGDKIVARNTRFISRLNLMPFVGAKRILFDKCHFECTDDAMCATGVYLNCTMDFYSSKPFYATTGTGAVLLNCDVRLLTRGEQYFTKGGGQVTVIDTRFTSENASYIGWRDVVAADVRNYQHNVTLNGQPLTIGSRNPSSTVDMTGKKLLDAYKFEYLGKTTYNIYNLLCGNDDWDPLGMKEIVADAEKKNGNKYTMQPVQLLIIPGNEKVVANPSLEQLFVPARRLTIETGRNDVLLAAKVYRFSVCELKGEAIRWSVAPEHSSLVKLAVQEDGSYCRVIPANTADETYEVIVNASTPSGLEAAYILNVAPSKLDPPEFIYSPEIAGPRNGKLTVSYKLDMRFEDQSLITWYRCTDSRGSNPIEVAVSRFGRPLYEYELSEGDIGYYIRAEVAPRHVRCEPGKPVDAVTRKPVKEKQVKGNRNILQTDFRNISTKNQPEVIPGFWTMTHGSGSAADRNLPGAAGQDAWYYGAGTEGSAGLTGLLQGRTGRLLYTPVGEDFGNMKLSMTVAPSKTAGQGFSIAHLYMDILIKFDTKTMTGYALRFIRTTKYGDAVDCMFMKYDKGTVTEISKPVTTSCYRTPCNITIEVNGNIIKAHADTPADYYKISGRPEVLPEVNIETVIEPSRDGGFGIEFNGGASSMIRELRAEWK